ncbi:MAG: hypothetical protein EHM58_12450 [Ignavibacteriae bacterium]|nr:MAG: hypothetical protein EHM58_12450 [Ignavibacteriota bacterium]
MKIINLLFLFLLIPLISFSQTIDTTLYEKELINFCGKIVVLDGIWVSEGKLKADISVLERVNSKPVTGGYSAGESIFINDSCRLYINFIKKTGFKDAVGYAVLTSFIIDIIAADNCTDKMELLIGQTYTLNNKEYKIKELPPIRGLPGEVALESVDEKIVLKIDDIYWNTKCLLKLTYIDNKKIIFEKQDSYFYSSGDVIPGELINAPVTEDLYKLIIRRAPKQKSMKAPESEEKISLLKIYFKVKEHATRPTIEYEENGVKTWLVYDVIRTFESEEEALNYAKENNITDIKTK